MKIITIILREIQIPYKNEFITADNLASQKSLSAILEIHTNKGIIGFGEACPRVQATGETIQSIRKDLSFLEPILQNEEVFSILHLREKLTQWEKLGIGNATICAFEMAWLDAWSKMMDLSLPKILDISLPDTLNYTLVIPMLPPNRLIQLLKLIKHYRPSEIKLQVNNNRLQILENIHLLKMHFGKNISIRVDANGSWTLEEAKQLIPKLMRHSITTFEQPLPVFQTKGLKEITSQFGESANISLDESLMSFQHVEYLLQNGIGNALNLKISKTGGIFRTLDIYHLAQQHGVPCQVGSYFGETNLMKNASILFAGLCKNLIAHEGAFGDYSLENDWTDTNFQLDIYGNLDTENLFLDAGFTSAIDFDFLERYTCSRSDWGAKNAIQQLLSV